MNQDLYSFILNVPSLPDTAHSYDGDQTTDYGKCVLRTFDRNSIVNARACVNSLNVYIVIPVAVFGSDTVRLHDTLISVHQHASTPTSGVHDLSGTPARPVDDLMLMGGGLTLPQLPILTSGPPQLLPPPQAGDQSELWGFGSLQSSLSEPPASGKPAASTCEF